jgi:hypothetical protein
VDEALSSRTPKGFTFELCGSDRRARKNPLIELKPVWRNRR